MLFSKVCCILLHLQYNDFCSLPILDSKFSKTLRCKAILWGQRRLWIVMLRNRCNYGKSSSGDKKMSEIHFDKTKPSHISLTCWKCVMLPLWWCHFEIKRKMGGPPFHQYGSNEPSLDLSQISLDNILKSWTVISNINISCFVISWPFCEIIQWNYERWYKERVGIGYNRDKWLGLKHNWREPSYHMD